MVGEGGTVKGKSRIAARLAVARAVFLLNY